MNLDDLKKMALNNPAVRAEYDLLDDEFETIDIAVTNAVKNNESERR